MLRLATWKQRAGRSLSCNPKMVRYGESSVHLRAEIRTLLLVYCQGCLIGNEYRTERLAHLGQFSDLKNRMVIPFSTGNSLGNFI